MSWRLTPLPPPPPPYLSVPCTPEHDSTHSFLPFRLDQTTYMVSVIYSHKNDYFSLSNSGTEGPTQNIIKFNSIQFALIKGATSQKSTKSACQKIYLRPERKKKNGSKLCGIFNLYFPFFFITGIRYIHIDIQANTTHRTLNNCTKEVLNMIKD